MGIVVVSVTGVVVVNSVGVVEPGSFEVEVIKAGATELVVVVVEIFVDGVVELEVVEPISQAGRINIAKDASVMIINLIFI
jgi:hypothetical protein